MSRYRTAGLFVLLAALWGSSFTAARAGLPDVPPVMLAALRFDVAGALMVGYAAATADAWRPRTRSEWLEAAVGGLLFVAAHHALLFAGQQYVTSAVAAVVVALDPVLAAGFAALVLADERLSPTGVVGMLLGVAGVAIIADPNPETLAAADRLGVVLVFLAAAAFALGAVLTRRFRTDLPAVTMQAWMMLLGAPVLHLVAVPLPNEGFGAIRWTPAAFASLAYLSVVAAGAGYLLYFKLLDRVGPVEVNLVGYVAPAFAALTGWIILGESIAVRTVAGFVVIALGFALVKRRELAAEIRTFEG